jgi:tetratricopeptide (TPR) repeat protein
MEDFFAEHNLNDDFPKGENNIDILLDLADVAAYQENWCVLEKIASRIIELDPNNEDALFYKGQSMHAIDDKNKESLKFYDRIISIGKDRKFLAYWGKSVILYNVGEYEKSLKCCEQLLKLVPNHQKAWELKGQIFTVMNRKNDSEDCFAIAEKLTSN